METDWAWAAGLFEGEGSISFVGKNSVRLQMSLTDEDVLRKFHSVVSCGSIVKMGWYEPTKKQAYLWRSAHKQKVTYILIKFIPYLGTRRGEKALQSLLRLENCRDVSVSKIGETIS